jgi:uncharacterized protein
MPVSVIVDASFVVALFSDRDTNHLWANEQARRFPPPWQTCEAVLAESFFLLGSRGDFTVAPLLRRRALLIAFQSSSNLERVLSLMQRYANVPMSFADACLVRMAEILPDPLVLTTDPDFRIYRRHGRDVVPCKMPR